MVAMVTHRLLAPSVHHDVVVVVVAAVVVASYDCLLFASLLSPSKRISSLCYQMENLSAKVQNIPQ